MNLELLLPLGLLGLLGIVALIIIYIIRPNYLTQHVPSTYVWKLSLKYRKRKLPTSRIRNILIFICQVLILTAVALILAKPALVQHNMTDKADVIAIVDSSASMYTESNDETRFQRAVSDVIDLTNDTFREGGLVSVILADDDPDFLGNRVAYEESDGLLSALKKLQSDGQACYYGVSDIAGAMRLSEDVLDKNPSAQIYLYTDVGYGESYLELLAEKKGIHVINVNDDSEWNAAILDASAQIVDTYCEITVQIASYHRSRELDLYVEISGADAADASSQGKPIMPIYQSVFCEADAVKTIVFRDGGGEDKGDTIYRALDVDQRFQTFQSINISIRSSGDNFPVDDSFNLYGGQKPVLKVQYASSRKLPTSSHDTDNPGPNPFVNGALGMVKKAFADVGRYDIQITEVQQGKEPALEGFDFYIFEHDMPEELPTDGVILLMDPGIGWQGAGLSVIGIQDSRDRVSCMENPEQSNHVVLKDPNGFRVEADRITLTRYKSLTCDPEYDVLMTCNSDPVFLVRKTKNVQVAVLSFSVHYSSLARENEMGYIFYNLFDYFFPGLVSDTALEVGEELSANSRGDALNVAGASSGYGAEFTEFPATMTFSLPDTYTFRDVTYFGKELSAEVFVTIPAYESNIWRNEDVLEEPQRREESDAIVHDLLIFLAAALTALLFVEWLLHAREAK